MSNNDMTREELVKLVTRSVVEALRNGPSIPVGVSNRHIHLCRADMDVLFGVGSEPTHTKDLRQPGQYACAETVTIRGPKREISKVRLLGPLRSKTQIEISVSDGFTLGISAPVRESGQIDGTPGIEIIGPCGTLTKERGVIVAMRHIHMSPSDAKKFGVADRDLVKVKVGDEIRGTVLDHVIIRVSESFVLEMHVDVEEANAVGVKNGDTCTICKE